MEMLLKSELIKVTSTKYASPAAIFFKLNGLQLRRLEVDAKEKAFADADGGPVERGFPTMQVPVDAPVLAGKLLFDQINLSSKLNPPILADFEFRLGNIDVSPPGRFQRIEFADGIPKGELNPPGDSIIHGGFFKTAFEQRFALIFGG